QTHEGSRIKSVNKRERAENPLPVIVGRLRILILFCLMRMTESFNFSFRADENCG
ncbi:MAG: hypothetical protein QG652_1597, partial [Pseudomonadota bacterium]|nr:hypothetical protein [Pseudomonadota bacterium]